MPENAISLGRLVAELESLYALFTDAGGGLSKAAFEEHWATLEEVFAVALDRKQEALDEAGTALVCHAVAALRSVVDKALASRPTT